MADPTGLLFNPHQRCALHQHATDAAHHALLLSEAVDGVTCPGAPGPAVPHGRPAPTHVFIPAITPEGERHG